MDSLSVWKKIHVYFNARFMWNLMVHYPTKIFIYMCAINCLQADKVEQPNCRNYSVLTKLGAT